MTAKKASLPLTVAVTGASGYVGAGLVRSLCADDRIERVLGFDVLPVEFSHPKFVFDGLDVRNPALEARLVGVDAVVHLAYVMDPIKDETRMRDVNVNGSQNVFKCAARAGARKIVYTSSAVVYGAHPDNDVPLTEDSPLRANLDFSYSAHKLEVEYVVRELRDEFPDVIATVLRPSLVFGPNVDNAWSRVLEMPLLVGVKGHTPPFQFVHEDDLAAALEFAVHHDLDGSFNLAPEDSLSIDEIREMIGRRRADLPEAAAFSFADRLWSLGLSDAPPGMLHYVMYPWIVSPAKLADAGFTCNHTSRETFAASVPHIKEHVRLGRSRVRRGDLVRGAAAGIGLVGAALTVSVARRRRLPVRL